MTTLQRYLYDGLAYTIETGKIPLVVDQTVVFSRNELPRTVWDVDFGKVTEQLKNAIETAIITDPNALFIESHIGPAYYISKRLDGATNQYFLTYIFEHDFYSTFVNKELSYVESGSNDILEGGIVIPNNMIDGNTPVVVPGNPYIKRKLTFLDTKLKIIHKYNGVYEMKVRFTEFAKPLPYSSMFVVGVSDADYLTGC